MAYGHTTNMLAVTMQGTWRNFPFNFGLRGLTLSPSDCYSQNIDKQRKRSLSIRPQSFL